MDTLKALFNFIKLVLYGLLVAGIAIGGIHLDRFLDIDMCLDRGGRVVGDMCEVGDGFVPLNCYGKSCNP